MKRFRNTYIIALIAISIFVVVGELAVQFGLRGLADGSHIINLSGRQRMISQKITKSALIMSQTESMDIFQERKKELTEALNNWRRSHEAFQKGDVMLGIKEPSKSKEILEKFAQIQPFFEEMKEAASKISILDFNSLDSAGRAQMKADVEVLLANEVKFLPVMEEITNLYSSEVKSKTNNTGLMAWISGVSIIGLIILLGMFFFEPLVKRTNNYLEEIEKQNKKLESAELEMRKTAEQQLELNEQLYLAQKQAQEQNEKLKSAEEETRKALEHQERSNQKLLIAQKELQKTLVEQNRINQKLVEAQKFAEQKATEIEKSEKEMRQLAEAQLEANEQLMLTERQLKKNLEKELEQRKEIERLSLVASKTDNAVIISNAEGLIEWVNDGFEELTEYKFEEVKGRKPGSFLQGEKTNPADVFAIRRGLTSRKSFYQEIYNYSKSGRGYWLGINITPLFDEQNSLTGFIAIESDITERKEAEIAQEKRRLKSEKYTTILTKLSTTSFEEYGSLHKALQSITEMATKGLDIERASIWDYTGDSIVCEDLFEASKQAHDAGIELFAKDFPSYFEGVRSGLVINASDAHKHPNTFEFSEVYLKPLGINSMLDVPIRVAGELVGVICCEYVGNDFREWSDEDENFVRSLSDIVSLMIEADKRRQAEEELKKAFERMLQSELDMRQLAEAQLEANEKLMMAEREAKQALEKAKRAEEDMRQLAEAQLEANEKLMFAEKQLKENLEIEQKQKEELDRLVAQLKDTQGQLVHNEKMASLGQLTAGIAHEINNPINFVYNGIDTLKISLDDLMEIINKYNEIDNANGNRDTVIEEAKKLKEQLDFEELTQDIEHLVSDIKKGAIRTMEIVKGLRVFSRLDEEERKMASIKDCLDSTLVLLNNKIKGRIELKSYYDETMPEVLCYPGQLNQVFMNIINNAIQAIPEARKDGVISVYTENMQENIVIRIKDNGMGMSEQVKRRIFEPFFTTKAVGVGTGLGLSITFGIIEKHNGQIFVNSEEGRGTEFVIQLPKDTA